MIWIFFLDNIWICSLLASPHSRAQISPLVIMQQRNIFTVLHSNLWFCFVHPFSKKLIGICLHNIVICWSLIVHWSLNEVNNNNSHVCLPYKSCRDCQYFICNQEDRLMGSLVICCPGSQLLIYCCLSAKFIDGCSTEDQWPIASNRVLSQAP